MPGSVEIGGKTGTQEQLIARRGGLVLIWARLRATVWTSPISPQK